jgi:hypothetical protein
MVKGGFDMDLGNFIEDDDFQPLDLTISWSIQRWN